MQGKERSYEFCHTDGGLQINFTRTKFVALHFKIDACLVSADRCPLHRATIRLGCVVQRWWAWPEWPRRACSTTSSIEAGLLATRSQMEEKRSRLKSREWIRMNRENSGRSEQSAQADRAAAQGTRQQVLLHEGLWWCYQGWEFF